MIYLLTDAFLTVLGLYGNAGFFPDVVSRGYSLNCGSWAQQCGSRALERRLSSCGVWSFLLCGRWDLSKPGIKPGCPALAGGFFTTEPPGKLPVASFVFSFFLFVVVIVVVFEVREFDSSNSVLPFQAVLLILGS